MMPQTCRRLTRFIFCALVTASLTGRSQAQTAEPTSERSITIHPETLHGDWEGWGASLAWWAKVYGDRDDLADLFFTTKAVELNGTELPGLGMNIVRYNAGASSWAEIDGRHMVISETILPFRQIEGYWLDGKNPDPNSDSWDWSVDQNQRAMLLKARDRGADRIELFSNAPMWWMCKNDNPSGAAKATDDNLDPAHYQDFAHYLAMIARHAKDHWGINFTTVSPFNEPSSKWWHANCKQEGCHVSPTEQMKILPLVREAFDANGLDDVDLVASDESFYDEAVASWNAFTPEVKAIIDQVNVHGYQGAAGQRHVLHQIAHVEDGKRLWNSEHGDGDASGLSMAQNLHRDFHWLRPTAWAYWQPVDGGREGLGNSGWGLLDAKLLDGTNLKVNTKFYVFAQYSRHIRPGMAILDNSDKQTVVAYSPENRKLVIISLNDGAEAQDYRYDLSAFATGGSKISSWLTRTDASALYLPLSTDRLADSANIAARIPAKSVMTFELTGVSLR